MSEILEVSLSAIDANPFRRFDSYPFVERKIETLKRSIDDVGMWAGVIARKAGNRYQIAFGHHRIEAARRLKMKTVPLIIQDLDEEQMLQFMGRENMEDYNADFLCMLETWEAGTKHAERARGKTQLLDIAKLLGWTDERNQSNHTARACNDAYELIKAKHLTRKDLRDLSVKSVEAIVARVQARMAEIEEVAKKRNIPRPQIERAKERISSAGRDVAERAREGTVAQRDLRMEIDATAFTAARGATKQLMFETFGRSLADRIHRFLRDGDVSERLQSVVEALPNITEDEDRAIVRRLDYELAELSEHTCPSWRKKLNPKGNVVPLRLLKSEAN